MKTVKQVSDLSGLTVRTLHYYDEIGLLKPAYLTDAGYRMYGEEELRRLQTILILRQLDFPLREIKDILDEPDRDLRQLLSQQIERLTEQRQRIDSILSLAEKMMKGETDNMAFSPIDKSSQGSYEKEAERLWGETKEYKESVRKEKARSESENALIAQGLMDIFTEIGTLKKEDPASGEAIAAVRKIQEYITENYYTCSDEIFRSLGEMYVADERFKASIDEAGGEGTAEFVRDVIRKI